MIPNFLTHLPTAGDLPIPYFVWISPEGKPDFRMVDPGKAFRVANDERCWICGRNEEPPKFFIVGPISAANHYTPEGPMHRACAEFSLQACPFLNGSKPFYRPGGFPVGSRNTTAAMPTGRQPVFALVRCAQFKVERPAPREWAYRLGAYYDLRWFRDGQEISEDEAQRLVCSWKPFVEFTALKKQQEARDRRVEQRKRQLAKRKAKHGNGL